MDHIFIGFISAFWLGILTSVSPCPLATNIAAISFLAKKIVNPKTVFISGFVYTVGRTFSYALLGWIIISSLLSVPVLANLLQKYMNKAFGPILIITGLVLLDIFKISIPKLTFSKKLQDKLVGSGIGGAFILGLIFALVFCPVSAAIFFGSLIPLALKSKMGVILPFIYGIGTGLPVLLFAVGIALSVKSLSFWFHRLTKLEYYMRKVTGVIFIVVGLYYIGIYWLKIF
ncbi:MAG: aromatic aminobenezylarsenical efflux permease ArsG family transporter [Candidatus Omnitrophota bacterium]|nr:sulfite exporter TauE/SafE family protein [Candidatus Omnitrophota bacterium]MBU1929632.1 sulfite exporter TauE/SafE family protein [Candidatus Omnitrophota bacterium]